MDTIFIELYMGVEPKIGGNPKMDGLFHGKPYEQMDDLGVPLFLETPIFLYCHCCLYIVI